MSTTPSIDWTSLMTLPQDVVAATLAAPPFVSVDGVTNIRDFGGCPSSRAPRGRAEPHLPVRRGRAACGALLAAHGRSVRRLL